MIFCNTVQSFSASPTRQSNAAIVSTLDVAVSKRAIDQSSCFAVENPGNACKSIPSHDASSYTYEDELVLSAPVEAVVSVDHTI